MDKAISDFIPQEEYTLIAKDGFNLLQNDKKYKEFIASGNIEAFEQLLLNSRCTSYTFGAYIKRIVYELYISPDADDRKIDEISEDEYIENIQFIFKENGMKGVGTLQPRGTTRLTPANLKRWMKTPCNKIKREIVFLFGFGFNLFAEQVEILLTNALGQNSFNFRDYKEAIYYWCLKQNLGYNGVMEWLQKYEIFEIEKPTEKYIKETQFFRKRIELASNSEKFEQYLIDLKSRNLDLRNRITIRRIFNNVLNSMFYEISQERRQQVQQWKREKDSIDIQTIQNRKQVEKLQAHIKKVNAVPLMDILQKDIEIKGKLQDNILFLVELLPPVWTVRNIQDKLNGEIRIRREDILTAVFLTYAHQLENLMGGEEKEYLVRVETFIDDVNIYLEECGMGDFYIVNPYEMLLVLCLLYDKPYTFFLKMWSMRRYKLSES